MYACGGILGPFREIRKTNVEVSSKGEMVSVCERIVHNMLFTIHCLLYYALFTSII